MRTVVLVPLLVAALIESAAAQNVGGTYVLSGKNFDGSPYKGTVQITPTGSTCRIVWQTGNSKSEGLCMLSGKTLAAFY
jgi:hypothetical protein